MMKVLLAAVLFYLPVVKSSCDFPPSLWCSSPEVAKQCQVHDQCNNYNARNHNAGPVNLELYYESQCGACKTFFASQLFDVWSNLGPEVLNVTLVPYGNAKEKKTIFGEWKFTCQHGTDECVGNLIETCAMSLLKNVTAYLPFIHCIEKDRWGVPANDAPKCAKQLGIDYDAILSCANSKTGGDLEHEMALLTAALNPPHTYVPWVVINGVHTEKLENEAMNNLLQLVCDTYKGPTPKGCQKHKCYKSND